MQSEFTEEQPYCAIESKRRFNPGESPVFHFLNEQFDDLHDIKRKCPTLVRREPCNNKERSALIFHQQCDDVDFPIFRGFERNRQHLTADLTVVDPETGRKLDPCHASVYYLNALTQQVICVHVYYNALGHLSHTAIHAKMEEPDGSVTPIQLTRIQKEYILRQTQPTQQLLLVLLREKDRIQEVLLNTVKQLEEQLSEQHGKPESQPILEQLSENLCRLIRYNGVWDARLDFYELYLDNLHTKPEQEEAASCADTTDEAPSLVISKPQSGRSKKKSGTKKALSQKNRLILDTIRKFLDEWLAGVDPCNDLDDEQCIAWITKYHHYFMRLETLCRRLRVTLIDDSSILQTQWQRLPTRGPLFAYFEAQLFRGHTSAIGVLAPLMPETTALVELYERFLQAIEQDSLLRKERIETAHVLYACSPAYLHVLTTKKYQLKAKIYSKDNVQLYYGILIELFWNNNYDVFCMYVDQGLADATNLQLLSGRLPYHTLGAILSMSLTNSEAPRYLEKVMSSCEHVIWPHLSEVDFELYSVDGNKLYKEEGAYTDMHRGGNIRFVPRDMSQSHEITTLRFTLDLYTNYFRMGYQRTALLFYPGLIAKLLQYGDISCERLIKETMRFFDNSFFTTNYIAPSLQGIHPEIPVFSGLNEGVVYAKELARMGEKGASITVLFALCPDRPDQMDLKESTSDIARQLLKACLDMFNSCSPQEQGIIIDNLYQLAVLALKKRDHHECVCLARALVFCCISANHPSLEVHEAFIKATTLYITAYKMSLRSAEEGIGLLQHIKSLPSAYLNGLSAEVVEQLRVRNPVIIDKIRETASEVAVVRQEATKDHPRSGSPPLSEGPNMWKKSEQLKGDTEPAPSASHDVVI